MQTKATAQFRLCNMQQQKFLLDGVLSSWPEGVGALSNLTTQMVTGILSGNQEEMFGWTTNFSDWPIGETTIYQVMTEKVMEHWDSSDWRGLGMDLTEIMSSMVKIEAAQFTNEEMSVA